MGSALRTSQTRKTQHRSGRGQGRSFPFELHRGTVAVGELRLLVDDASVCFGIDPGRRRKHQMSAGRQSRGELGGAFGNELGMARGTTRSGAEHHGSRSDQQLTERLGRSHQVHCAGRPPLGHQARRVFFAARREHNALRSHLFDRLTTQGRGQMPSHESGADDEKTGRIARVSFTSHECSIAGCGPADNSELASLAANAQTHRVPPPPHEGVDMADHPHSRILITGGGRGIGAHLAQTFANSEHQLHLVGRDRDKLDVVATELRRCGGRVSVHAVDVSDARAVADLGASIQAEFGPPDLLVNNAGRLGPIGPTWEADPQEWWRDVEVNLRGVFLMCRAFVPSMIAAGRGRIVNLGGGGSVSPFPFASGYAASKAAVLRFTETLDEELGDSGVLAFSLSPGLVRTGMTERVASSAAGQRYLTELAERVDSGDTNAPAATAAIVERLHRGDLDALRGRFLHASHDATDLDGLIARAEEIVDRGQRQLTVLGL
jgi:NAD(P)-dependent dehydrogenase (short-subunit alcohol dehydrogenase family)